MYVSVCAAAFRLRLNAPPRLLRNILIAGFLGALRAHRTSSRDCIGTICSPKMYTLSARHFRDASNHIYELMRQSKCMLHSGERVNIEPCRQIHSTALSCWADTLRMVSTPTRSSPPDVLAGNKWLYYPSAQCGYYIYMAFEMNAPTQHNTDISSPRGIHISLGAHNPNTYKCRVDSFFLFLG